VAELFELARLDSGDLELEREAFSLPELAQDVAQKFKLRAEKQHVRLETELDVSAPQVEGDLRLLERTLENLLENALRHTEDGGFVRLCVSGSDSDSGKQLRVSVADTGCGIAAEDVPYIFDRFYRGRGTESTGWLEAAGRSEGSGLGLAIAKRVVELHGSQIAVDTAVGKGTEFSFHLAASR
jgi:signal transduction histidine kinase